MTGLAFRGMSAVIIKVGNFLKIVEQNDDGFKKGFDKIMLESVEEMNLCVESITIISSNFNKIFFILYDISAGNKYIKKDKDGKIIICSKTKLYSNFKNKIEELNNKVKKYEQELSKIKQKKSDSSISSEENDAYSDISSDDMSNGGKSDEFYLDS